MLLFRAFPRFVLHSGKNSSPKHDVLARVFEGLSDRGAQVERVQWLEEDADEQQAS